MDKAHAHADAEIEEMKRHLAQIYRDTMQQITAEMMVFARSIQKESNKLLKKIDEAETEDAKKSAKNAYKRFFKKAIKSNAEYEKASKSAENRLFLANIAATAFMNSKTPKIYAENYNEIGRGLERDLPDYELKPVSESEVAKYGEIEQQTVDKRKDTAWNRKILAAAVLTGAMLLLSPEKSVKRAVRIAAQKNYDTAARQASDLVTGAENKGRLDSMYRASDEGFSVKKYWMATLDNRTRETHRKYDGLDPVELDYEYAPGLKRPKDPDCPDLSEVCNCRCRILYDTGHGKSATRAARFGEVTGSYKDPRSFAGTTTYYVRNMSYREWMEWRSK